jgi:hypothetical protein
MMIIWAERGLSLFLLFIYLFIINMSAILYDETLSYIHLKLSLHAA